MSDYASNQELRNRFPHPLNNKIFDAPLFGHPDSDLLSSLSKILPQDMTDMTVVPMGGGILERFPANNEPILVHEGIVFAAYVSMRCVIRLPKNSGADALNFGGQYPHERWKLGPEWIDITRMQDSERRRLIQVAYQYAAELAREPIPIMAIIRCPNCDQKLRTPSNRGALSITCPKCGEHWLWSPDLER